MKSVIGVPLSKTVGGRDAGIERHGWLYWVFLKEVPDRAIQALLTLPTALQRLFLTKGNDS